MITVRRGKETTAIQFDGELGTIMLETISVTEALGKEIIKRVNNPEEVMYHFVKELIDAAWGNL